MKRIIFITLNLLSAVYFFGCGRTTALSTNTEPPVSNVSNSIGIYTIEPEYSEITQVFVQYNESITLQAIVSLVAQNMDEKVEVISCEKDGKKAIVTFSKNFAPMKGCNKIIEELILDCFSNSILDNVKGCKAVIFRGEQGAYEGEHFSFGVNEVYATK